MKIKLRYSLKAGNYLLWYSTFQQLNNPQSKNLVKIFSSLQLLRSAIFWLLPPWMGSALIHWAGFQVAAVVSAFVERKQCKQVDESGSEKKLMNQETNHFRQLQVSSCRELKYRNYFWLFGNWSTVTIFDFSGTEYVTKSEKSRDR